ncbi:hypothetical protein THTE_4497 [Thermogutta terrifontis]|uniref:Uncharacterized protein n=1 Tax=Thermogutta terrifontis TaxID=1331910 RepID=A0A286RMA1_9BACT|nr:hypothetical protein THTE_4497 [Thermogutta terrifontis]
MAQWFVERQFYLARRAKTKTKKWRVHAEKMRSPEKRKMWGGHC